LVFYFCSQEVSNESWRFFGFFEKSA
jgi:hypothetical protein